MIDKFRGRYYFLSNFCPCTIFVDGVDYPSVEHAYQASKTSNPMIRGNIRCIKNPGDVKRYSRTYEVKPNWDEIKPRIMNELLLQKFEQEPLRSMLLDTGDEEVIEGNIWHDRYWGICYCDRCAGYGENVLGVLLMRIRKEIFANA